MSPDSVAAPAVGLRLSRWRPVTICPVSAPAAMRVRAGTATGECGDRQDDKGQARASDMTREVDVSRGLDLSSELAALCLAMYLFDEALGVLLPGTTGIWSLTTYLLTNKNENIFYVSPQYPMYSNTLPTIQLVYICNALPKIFWIAKPTTHTGSFLCPVWRNSVSGFKKMRFPSLRCDPFLSCVPCLDSPYRFSTRRFTLPSKIQNCLSGPLTAFAALKPSTAVRPVNGSLRVGARQLVLKPSTPRAPGPLFRASACGQLVTYAVPGTRGRVCAPTWNAA